MEIELKFCFVGSIQEGQVIWNKFEHDPMLGRFQMERPNRQFLRDIYFDVPDRSLLSAGFRLRMRLENGDVRATLKQEHRQQHHRHERYEWEGKLTAEFLGQLLGRLDAAGIPVLHRETPDASRFRAGGSANGLLPVLEIRTQRLRRALTLNGGTVALLCLDQVDYPGHSPDVFYHIEVEHQEGQTNCLEQIETALIAMSAGQLAPSLVSKVKRGLALIAQPGSCS